MTDSQDLNANTLQDFQFQTPNRLDTQATQTQKSQASGRTFMNPHSHPNDYHNSASTTTSGNKTSNRSSDVKSNTQSSTGAAPAGIPNFSDMMPLAGGSQLPDTQGSPTLFAHRFDLSPRISPKHVTDHPPNIEVHYVSSQPSNSDPSQSSQQHNMMAAPAPPRHTSNLGAILNDEEQKPKLILDDAQLVALHQNLVSSTSGCSLEQLEQINASLMDAIWRNRGVYNRNVVLHKVQDAFNEIIADIQVMQDILKSSQDTPEPESQYPPRRPGFVRPMDDGYYVDSQPPR
jgi:hypothetical protein